MLGEGLDDAMTSMTDVHSLTEYTSRSGRSPFGPGCKGRGMGAYSIFFHQGSERSERGQRGVGHRFFLLS